MLKNNNLKGDIIKIKDGFIGKVVDVDDLVLVNVDGLPYFIELEYCELTKNRHLDLKETI